MCICDAPVIIPGAMNVAERREGSREGNQLGISFSLLEADTKSREENNKIVLFGRKVDKRKSEITRLKGNHDCSQQPLVWTSDVHLIHCFICTSVPMH